MSTRIFMVNYMQLSEEDERTIKIAVKLIVSEAKANPLADCLHYPNNLMFVVRNIQTSEGSEIEEKTLQSLIEPTVRLAWLEFQGCKDMFDDPNRAWFTFLKRKLAI